MMSNAETTLPDQARLAAGLFLLFASMFAGIRFGFWIAGLRGHDTALIFGIAIAVYLFFAARENRRSSELPGRTAFSVTAWIISVLSAIVLAMFARVIPILGQ